MTLGDGDGDGSAPRFGIVAPTYDNARTLRGVLDRLDVLGLPIVAVDDGSTDATAALLAEWSRESGPSARTVLTHATNRGKAEAMRTGFEHFRAAARPHEPTHPVPRPIPRPVTHAVTIDTDGQLDPEDIPALLVESASEPRALVVGVRDDRAADYPRRSRFGRRVSNVMVWLASGVRVRDSQCGLRVYPLATLERLAVRGGRYEFETECIIRAGWAGVPIREVDVRCRYQIDGGRVSHFRVGRDSLRALVMHMRLLTRSLWPFGPRREPAAEPTGTIGRRLAEWMNPMDALRQARADRAGSHRIALAFGVGAFIANLPVYGFQTLLSLAAAQRFRLHPLVTVAGAHLSTPPLGPLLIAAAIAIGHLIMTGSWPSLVTMREQAVAELAMSLLAQWLIGSIVVGAALAILAYVATFALLALLRWWAPTVDHVNAPRDASRNDDPSATIRSR